MTAQLAPTAIAKFFDNNGAPLAFGLLFTYAAGTTTLQATYIDSTQTTQNLNPIQLNFRGECNLWLDPSKSYKFLLQDSQGNQISGWPIDNITVGNANPSFSIIPTSDNLYTLGSPTFSWANVYVGANHAPVLDTVSGNIGYYKQTPAEIAASVTPVNYAYPVQGPFVHLWRYMSNAQITSILGNGLTDTTSGFNSAMAVLTAMNGGTLIIPSGNYSNGSIVTLSNFCKIIGMGTRRGAGTPPSTGKGVSINATFAGPLFQVTNGALTPVDVLIEGINFNGNKGTYGAGDGIDIVLSAGVTIRDCVVANFGTNNISLSGAGAYGLACEHVYSAQAGNANFFIDGSDSRLSDCQSDGAAYSVYATANAQNLAIVGGDHYEGATNTGLRLLASRIRVTNTLVRITVNGATGIYLGNSEIGISNCEVFGSGSTTGNIALDIAAGATAYRVVGCRLAAASASTDTVRLADGGILANNIIEAGGATSTALELINPPNSLGVIEGNFISGTSNSILHTSGNGKWKIGTNRLENAASPGTFLPMTVTAGFPLYGDYYDGNPPSIASAAALPITVTGATTFSVTGTTNITSISATGFTGKTIVLIFTGILTVTNGSNLKLTGNFTTAAGSALILASDGTNWYEVGRKA